MASANATSASEVLLSQAEQDFIVAGCREDCRLDGRKCTDLRPYTILTGNEASSTSSSAAQAPLMLSSGSARLVGSCHPLHLLCSVKAEVVHPASLTPTEGSVELHVDSLTPHMSRKELERMETILQQLLVGSQAFVDTHGLCIVPHEYVWRLHVDLYLLEAGGGSLLDAASHLIRAALQETLLPLVVPAGEQEQSQPQQPLLSDGVGAAVRKKDATTDLVLEGDIRKARPPPGVHERALVVVTVAVLRGKDGMGRPYYALVADATLEEETCAVALVHVAVELADAEPPQVSALHKAKEGALPLHLLPDISTFAVQIATQSNSAYTIHPSTGSLLEEQFRLA